MSSTTTNPLLQTSVIATCIAIDFFLSGKSKVSAQVQDKN